MLTYPPASIYKRPTTNQNALLFIVLLVLAFPLGVAAQGSGRSNVGTGGRHILQGYVFFPSGRRAEGAIQVKLESYSAGELSVIADSGGTFVFTGLAPGNYTVVIDAGKNYDIVREGVYIDSDLNLGRMGIPQPNTSRRYTVMIHLEPKADSAPRAKPAVIDAAMGQVPEDARKIYEKGVELAKGGESAKAVDSFKAAVAAYPNFPIALNELGVQYLKLGKADKAVEVLNTATKLDPGAFSPRLNLGIALLEAKRFSDAQTQLNEAIKRNSTSAIPRLYLGLTLAHLDNLEGAEKELQQAISIGGSQVPLAHYYLGGLYWKKREYSKAVVELEKYLELAPHAADAERVRMTIKELRNRMQ